MKLSRLDTAAAQASPTQAAERPVANGADRVRRVEASEPPAGDRERSLAQELAEFESAAIAPFAGRDKIGREASAVAARLKTDGFSRLLRPGAWLRKLRGVDDSA